MEPVVVDKAVDFVISLVASLSRCLTWIHWSRVWGLLSRLLSTGSNWWRHIWRSFGRGWPRCPGKVWWLCVEPLPNYSTDPLELVVLNSWMRSTLTHSLVLAWRNTLRSRSLTPGTGKTNWLHPSFRDRKLKRQWRWDKLCHHEDGLLKSGGLWDCLAFTRFVENINSCIHKRNYAITAEISDAARPCRL